MIRTTIKNLAARKVRLATTSLAVLLGVAFMAGTLVLTDTMGKTFDTLFADVNAGTDAYIRGETAFSSDMGDQRPRLDAGIIETVRATDGVAVAEGSIQSYAQIVGQDGEPIGNPAMGAPTYGANWVLDDDVNPFDLAEGRPPEGRTEVVIDKASADEGGLRVGDTTTVLTQAGPKDVTVVGVATFGDADSPAGTSFALFDLPTAEEYLTEPGKVDAIRVVAEDGVSDADLVARLSGVVPGGVEVLTGDELTAENRSDVQADLGFFNTFMLTFALIALFVGSFIIYNSFSILVAQRSREMALLRAIGASRRQVLGSVLFEALVVGAIASLVGLAAGVGVAALLKALLAGMGLEIPTGRVVVTSNTVIVSLLAGVVVSVASAVFPARKAAKVAPVAAMRMAATEPRAGSRRRVLSGGAVTAIGAALIASGLLADAGIAAVGLGAATVFVGVAILGPTIARPVSRVIGAPLPRLRGMVGTLGRENAMRNPKRTSSTAAALMIGVALVGFITIIAATTKASIDRSVDEAFTGDLVVDSGSFGFGGLSPELAQRVDALPEVAAATGLRSAPAQVDGSRASVIAADPVTMAEIFDFGVADGSLGDLGAAEIAVHETTAEERGLEVGDTVSARFAETGAQDLTVAAIYAEQGLAGEWFVGLPVYEASVADQFDMKVFVTLADGVSLEDGRAAVTSVTDEYPLAELQDREEFKAAQGDQIDQILTLIYAMLALAVFIALLGIGNTLALSIFERTRELGLLRAVGMTRRQLRSTVRWESVIIALLGTAMGLVIGVAFAWAIVTALSDEGLSALHVPVGQLAVVAGIAAAAGVVAAILPARRAARLNVLDAIRTG